MQSEIQTTYSVLAVLSLGLGVLAAVHALLNKREPYACVTWVFLSLSLPFIGPLLYLVLGFNRIHRHASRLMNKSKTLSGPSTLSAPPGDAEPLQYSFHQNPTTDPPIESSCPQTKEDRRSNVMRMAETIRQGSADAPAIPSVPAALLPQHVRVLAGIGYAVTGYPLIAGNRIDTYYNGDEAYPAMLEAINQATEYVWLDTYIFDNDRIGKKFVDALGAAKDRGVEVRVQVDGIGTLLTFPRIDKVLNRRGVKTARFIPPRLIPPQFSINLRNHRKLLLIDGKGRSSWALKLHSLAKIR